jgi:hypothetical protein
MILSIAFYRSKGYDVLVLKISKFIVDSLKLRGLLAVRVELLHAVEIHHVFGRPISISLQMLVPGILQFRRWSMGLQACDVVLGPKQAAVSKFNELA